MNKKNQFLFSKLLIIFFITIFLFNAAAAAAYYQADEYRRSLLKVRDAEKVIRNVKKDFKNAQNNFSLISTPKIENKLELIDSTYNQLLKAYQEKDDVQVKESAALIIKRAENLSLEIMEAKPVQMRAFWLDSGTLAKTGGKAGLQKLLDLAQKANFNLIFPETYYKGLSIIPSNELFKQDPRFKNWNQDPLKLLIAEAKKREIEVHPWVWVFNENTSGKIGRILTENPGWANKNKAGEIVSYHNSTWLSPANTEVKTYLKQRYQYLVKNYELDGLNLDYIRFPEEYRGSFGYDQQTVAKFKEKYNLDPFKISSGDQQAALWNKYRESLITEMVKETSKSLRAIDPELLISADVIPGIKEARYRAMQNWSLWLEKDYLDFVIPMTYTENLFSEISDWIKEDRKVLTKPLYAGISVFKLSSKQLINQIQLINDINPNGMSLFAAAHLKESDYQKLSQGIFSNSALLPNQNKERSLLRLKDFILKRLKKIQKQQKIENHKLIRIRVFLNQKLNNKTKITFNEFIARENLKLDSNVKEVLVKDFDYLDNIIKLY